MKVFIHYSIIHVSVTEGLSAAQSSVLHSVFRVALHWSTTVITGSYLFLSWRCSLVLLVLVLKTGYHCVNKTHDHNILKAPNREEPSGEQQLSQII